MGIRGEMRHEELLNAALELFAANGYETTSTRSVAERTGVTEAVLFQHFPTKRDLFLAVLDKFGPEQLIRLPVEELDALPFAEALTQQITAFLDASWENRQWLHVLFHSVKREPEAAEELCRQYQSVREGVRRLMERRAARGEVRPEMIDAAQMVLGFTMRGFNVQSWHNPSDHREQDRDEFVHSLVSVVAGGVMVKQ